MPRPHPLFVVWPVVLVLGLCLPPTISAETYEMDWCGAMRDAELIVIGRIEDAREGVWEGSHISTVVVDDVLLGTTSSRITFVWWDGFPGPAPFHPGFEACFFLSKFEKQQGTYRLARRHSWTEVGYGTSIRDGVDIYQLHMDPKYRRRAQSRIDTLIIDRVFGLEQPITVTAIDSIEQSLYIAVSDRRGRNLSLAVTRFDKDTWFDVKIREKGGWLRSVVPGDEERAALELLRTALLPFDAPVWGKRYWFQDYPCPFMNEHDRLEQPREVLAYRNALCRLRHVLGTK